MIKCLFENDYVCWSLDELSNAGFEQFKSSNILNDDYGNVISEFYGKLYDGQFNIPFYHCLPVFNSIVGEKKFKFAVVNIGDDEIFFAYKVIQILATKQVRVFDLPISRLSNNENVEKIIRILRKKDFVKFAFLDVHSKPFDISKCQRLVEYDNYYYHNTLAANIRNDKKRKYGINEFNASGDFAVSLTNTIPLSELRDIRADFNAYLVSRGSKINKNDDKEFFAICTSNEPRVCIMAMRYKNMIIHLTVMYVVEELGVAYTIYDISRHTYDKGDAVLKRAISHNMTEKTRYFTSLLLPNINVIYVLGCRPSEKRLLEHKAQTCDGKIEYYITK